MPPCPHDTRMTWNEQGAGWSSAELRHGALGTRSKARSRRYHSVLRFQPSRSQCHATFLHSSLADRGVTPMQSLFHVASGIAW